MNDTSFYPVSLDKTDDRQLRIVWNDSLEQLIGFRELRRACQCATCMEKAKAKSVQPELGVLPVLSAAETMSLDIVAMRPTGNYAYNIQFSDGHSTGLFTLELLRSLVNSD